MPKKTFNNLPEEKREHILDVAAKLFVQKGFHSTDIDQIARAAGVAKGSIYNYFQSKDDLYIHVCRHYFERAREAMWGEVEPDWTIYQQVEHIFRQHIPRVGFPEGTQLYLNLTGSGMQRFADELSYEWDKYGSTYLKRALKNGIDKGIVRSDVNINLAAFLIHSMYLNFLTPLVSRHFEIRMKQYLEMEGDLNEETIKQQIEMVIDLINRFLKPASHDRQESMQTTMP